MVSPSSPRNLLVSKSQQSPHLKPSMVSLRSPRPLGFRHIITSSSSTLLVNVTSLVLHIVWFHKCDTGIVPPFVLSIAIAILALLSTIIDLHLRKEEDITGTRPYPRFRAYVQQVICLLAFIAVIFSAVKMTLEGIDSDGRYTTYCGLSSSHRIILITFSCLAIVCDAWLAVAVARLTWRPVHRAARSSMAITSLLQFVVGTLFISVNWQPFVDRNTHMPAKTNFTFALHQHVGSIISTVSVLGFVLCIAIREGDRINGLFTRFIRFYVILSAITAILCIILLGLSLMLRRNPWNHSLIQMDAVMFDHILAGTTLFLLGINFVAANYLQEPPASHLAVETIDLGALTPVELDAYARLINRYGKQVPGAPSGEAAISLMQAYTGAFLPKNMTCVVLRVYKPTTPTPHKLKQIDARGAAPPYEQDRAWRHLDEELMVLRQSTTNDNGDSLNPISTPVSPPKLSKNKQKRLARLQATAAANGGILIVPPEPIVSPRDIEAERALSAKLESTEALVLMTVINDYDLTASVKSWPGRLLQRALGSESYFKPLCIRMGLLAFHWPFRESIFFCSSSRRPVARNAAVLRAIAEWNKRREGSERCTVLLDPTYQHEASQRAIEASGWQSVPLPPSHIIDLRPYKDKTLPEYLKSIKYRDQEVAFKKAGGEVVESKEFTVEECSEVMRLWRQIAEKRTSDGETAVLATPDDKFLMQLRSNDKRDRTLMFLKVDNHTVASCVLFRLGDTITSDLQGLDYERARPLRAYFVMMQHVIAIALREGCNFVDFGPTTAQPKVDIGCKSVPLTGATFVLSPIISAAIRLSARNTRKNLSRDSTKHNS